MAIANRAAYRAQKVCCRGNVLQRMAATKKIADGVGMVLGIVILDKPHPVRRRAPDAPRQGAGIDADASIVAELTQQQEKIAFAAPDFQNAFISQTIAID